MRCHTANWHGTPEPGRISYAQSHGCVRLTNWDAQRIAAFVQPGTRVVFRLSRLLGHSVGTLAEGRDTECLTECRGQPESDLVTDLLNPTEPGKGATPATSSLPRSPLPYLPADTPADVPAGSEGARATNMAGRSR